MNPKLSADIQTAVAKIIPRLPDSYVIAKVVLANCNKIDECKDWADKAEALSSYAKQANDTDLRKMADKIQARAIKRCGQLLKEFDGRGRPPENKDGAVPNKSQQDVAEEAGLSERQTKTAVRVANVPEDDFEEQVESDDPPTVTALAEQGKKTRPLVDLEGIPPQDFARATELQGLLRLLADFCSKHDSFQIASAYKPKEVSQVQEFLASIDIWLTEFSSSLQGEDSDV